MGVMLLRNYPSCRNPPNPINPVLLPFPDATLAAVLPTISGRTHTAAPRPGMSSPQARRSVLLHCPRFTNRWVKSSTERVNVQSVVSGTLCEGTPIQLSITY